MLTLGWEYAYSVEIRPYLSQIVINRLNNNLSKSEVLKEDLKPIISAKNNVFVNKLKKALWIQEGFWITINYESLLDFLIRLKEAHPLMVHLQEFENFIKTKVLIIENPKTNLIYHTDETCKKAVFKKTPQSEAIIKEGILLSEKLKNDLMILSKNFEEMILQFRIIYWDFDGLSPEEVEKVKQIKIKTLEDLNTYAIEGIKLF